MPNHTHTPRKPAPYPLRPRPFPDESLFGFLHRFADRNGLPRVTWLMHDLKVPIGSSFLSPSQIAKFSVMSSVEAAELQALQMVGPTARAAQLLGSNVRLQYVARRRSRMCLHCIDDSPYHRLAWSLLPVTHCPTHAVPLIDTCPTCDIPLKWHRPNLSKCANGHDIRAHHSPIWAAQEPDVSGICALYECCGYHHGRISVSDTLAPAIRTLPPGSLIELFLWLHELSERVGAVSGTRSREGANPVPISVGFRLAQNWPSSLFALLQPCIVESKSFLDPNLTKWITKSANRISPAARDIVLSALISLAQSRARTKVFGVLPPPDDDLVSTSQARQMVNGTLANLSRLAIENGWYHDSTSSGWLVRSRIEAWQRERRSRVSMNAVCKQLGTKRRNVVSMISMELFGADASKRLSARRTRLFLYKEELERFLDSVDASVEELDSSSKLASWMSFNRRTELSPVSLPMLMQAVLDGRIRPVGKPSHKIARLQFRWNDLLSMSRSAASNSNHRPMSVEELCQNVQVGERYIYRALALGLINYTRNKKGQVLITLGDAAKFLDTYTWADRLAKQHGKEARSLGVMLCRSEIETVDGPDRNGLRIYRRIDIERLDLALILQRAKRASSKAMRLGYVLSAVAETPAPR